MELIYESAVGPEPEESSWSGKTKKATEKMNWKGRGLWSEWGIWVSEVGGYTSVSQKQAENWENCFSETALAFSGQGGSGASETEDSVDDLRMMEDCCMWNAAKEITRSTSRLAHSVGNRDSAACHPAALQMLYFQNRWKLLWLPSSSDTLEFIWTAF